MNHQDYVHSQDGWIDMAQSLRDTIFRIVSEELAPATIVDLEVSHDSDHDGDPILRIEIVFDTKNGRLDSDKILGLGRHLREPLLAQKETGFPIFSFMTPEERTGAAA